MKIEITIITAIVLILTGLLFFGIKGLAERQKWLDTHCVVMGKQSGSVGIGNTFTNGKSGISTMYILGKTGYKCDDGIEYWE